MVTAVRTSPLICVRTHIPFSDVEEVLKFKTLEGFSKKVACTTAVTCRCVGVFQVCLRSFQNAFHLSVVRWMDVYMGRLVITPADRGCVLNEVSPLRAQDVSE
jgi:hypothetical protein